jgi:hypothetical protein
LSQPCPKMRAKLFLSFAFAFALAHWAWFAFSVVHIFISYLTCELPK